MCCESAEQREAQLAELLEHNRRRLAELLCEELDSTKFRALASWVRACCAMSHRSHTVNLLVATFRGEPTDEIVEHISRWLLSSGLGLAGAQELAVGASRAVRRLLVELGCDAPQDLALAAGRVEQASERLHRAVDVMVSDQAHLAGALLERLYQSVGEAILLVDATTGRVLRANQAAEKLSGYTQTQLRWLYVRDLLPDLVAVRWAEILTLSEQDESLRLECPLTSRSGERFAVRVTAGKFSHAGRPMVHLAIDDITDQVRLTERLADLAATLRSQVEEQMREIDEQRDFLASILDALPTRLIVLDQDMNIIHANLAYYRQRSSKIGDVIGQKLSDVFPPQLMEAAGLEAAIANTLASGESVSWSGFRMATPDHPERLVDIRLDPCRGPRGERFVLLTIEDVTLRQRQLYERTLLQQIMRAMLESSDLRRLLYAILTGMTAGGTCGLGFNRAFLLLADEEEGVLRGQMAVGPESREEAYCIWAQVANRYQSIEDFMQAYDASPPDMNSPLAELVKRMVFPMREVDRLPMLAVSQGSAVHVTRASEDPRVPRELYKALGVEEFVAAPLVVKDKVIGVAIADNFVTNEPIGEDDVSLLTSLANYAALALDNARAREQEHQRAEELREAYEQLAKAQQELVRSKQLAAIGEVAAIVAHEIRNPLSTIGGFARHLVRWAGDRDRVERNAQIILDEVQRLEGILNDLLEMSRPRALVRKPTDVGALVEELGEMMANSPLAENINVKIEVEPDVPLVLLDAGRFRQVVNNLMRNGIEAMPEGGTLTLRVRRQDEGVAIEVQDTGEGIPEDRLSSIFDAFVTSKPTGTGLGLALSRAIVRQHDAQLTVKSKPSQGTVFTVWFPPEACVRRETVDVGDAQEMQVDR